MPPGGERRVLIKTPSAQQSSETEQRSEAELLYDLEVEFRKVGRGEPAPVYDQSAPIKPASIPISSERWRGVSLATSFGSCGSLYKSLFLCPKTVENALTILLFVLVYPHH